MRIFMLGAAAALALSLMPGPARAQDVAVLQLQQRLIAERRIADDRESALLRQHSAQRTDLQRQLTAARRQGASSKTLVASLTRKLNASLAQERELVTHILRRDPVSQILVGGLETELAQLSASSAPAARKALDQFAAGDRTGAWSRVEPVARAGSARDKRLAARLRMIMFNFQDPGVTAADVRDRWRSAVDADPTNSLAWVNLATAEQYMGNVQPALDALTEAAKRSKTAEERHLITWQRSLAVYVLQDTKLLIEALTDQLAATRALAGTSTPEINRRWMEHQTLVSLAQYQQMDGKWTDAVASLGEAIRIIDRLRQDAPNSRFIDDALANTLLSLGFIHAQINNLDEGIRTYERAIGLLEERIRAVPADAAPARASLINAHLSICNIKQQQKLVKEAVPICRRVIEIEKQQPRSAMLDNMIAAQSLYLARMLLTLDRDDEAEILVQEAVRLWKELIAVQDSASLLASYADALHQLAILSDEVCWRDVVVAWAAAEQKTAMADPYAQAYARAKNHAARENNCGGRPA